MELAFVPLALVAGGLLAVQAGANMQLGKATGSPLSASALQLGVGTATLLVAAALTGARGERPPLAPGPARRRLEGDLGDGGGGLVERAPDIASVARRRAITAY